MLCVKQAEQAQIKANHHDYQEHEEGEEEEVERERRKREGEFNTRKIYQLCGCQKCAPLHQLEDMTGDKRGWRGGGLEGGEGGVHRQRVFGEVMKAPDLAGQIK